LANPREHPAIAYGHDVTALQRCRAEKVEAEWATVSGQVRIPEFPVAIHEHWVVAVDGQQVQRFPAARRPEHRVDADTAEEPGGRIPGEELVWKRRQHEKVVIIVAG